MIRKPGRRLRRVRYVVVHHSATPDGRVLDFGAIRRYHTSYRAAGEILTPEEARARIDRGDDVVRPWDDIGYHFVAEFVAGEPVVLAGRPLDRTGAHVRGFNHETIGLCFVGDYNAEAPPEDLLEVAASRVIVPALKLFGLRPDRLVGHRDLDPARTCPGARFDLDAFRALVSSMRLERT